MLALSRQGHGEDQANMLASAILSAEGLVQELSEATLVARCWSKPSAARLFRIAHCADLCAECV